MSASRQKMMLPIHCAQHAHIGYGTSNDCPCPWCQVESLRATVQKIGLAMVAVKEVVEPESPQWHLADRVLVLISEPAPGDV